MKRFIFMTLVVFGVGCGTAPVTPGSSKNTASQADVGAAVRDSGAGSAGKTDDVQLNRTDETVSVPSSVTGALLHCAIASDPGESKTELTVGCRLQSQDGVRIPLRSIAELSIFSYEAPWGAKDSVDVRNLPEDAPYDVAYTFKGKTLAEAALLAKATDVQVAFHKLLNGEKDKGISVKLGTILKVALATLKGIRDIAVSVYAVIKAKPEPGVEGVRKKAQEIGSVIDDRLGEIEALFKKIFAEQALEIEQLDAQGAQYDQEL